MGPSWQQGRGCVGRVSKASLAVAHWPRISEPSALRPRQVDGCPPAANFDANRWRCDVSAGKRKPMAKSTIGVRRERQRRLPSRPSHSWREGVHVIRSRATDMRTAQVSPRAGLAYVVSRGSRLRRKEVAHRSLRSARGPRRIAAAALPFLPAALRAGLLNKYGNESNIARGR